MIEKIKENIILILIATVLIVGAIIYLIVPEETPKQTNTYPTTNADNLTETEYIYIDIKGEVHNPGVYKLVVNTRLYELIFKAGGLTVVADEAAINLSKLLSDGEVIYIPNFDDLFPPLGINQTDNTSEQQGNSQSLVNINTATINELTSLPGVGESTANAIIDYRQENGEFLTTEDITNVPGIGDVTYENLKELITVS